MLPKHNPCGPFDLLDIQLDEKNNAIPSQNPYNQVDADLKREKDYKEATLKADKYHANKRCYNHQTRLNLKTCVE